MLDLVQIDQLQHQGPDREMGGMWTIDDLSSGEINARMRACERWYSQHQTSFAAFNGQYLVISFHSWQGSEAVEMRNIAISPSSLSVVQNFERQFGTSGCYLRRVGDPILEF
jgi:hypothetical protein